jgi:hypothetical protein
MATVSEGPLSADLSRYLAGANFPMRKDALVHTLRRNHAPYEVIAHVERISKPETMFESLEELQAEYDDLRVIDPSLQEGTS